MSTTPNPAPFIFNLGLPKSGTTTFKKALKEAGLKVGDHRIRRGQSPKNRLRGQFVGDVLYRGYFTTGNPLEEMADFDAIAEASYLQSTGAWPQMDFGLIRALIAHRPATKFVATWREPAALSASMGKWTNMGTRLERADIPGLPHGYGGTDAERIRWIEGHYAQAEAMVSAVAPFLLLDVAAEDAHERLKHFLGIDLPWWGRANENRTEDDEDEDEEAEA